MLLGTDPVAAASVTFCDVGENGVGMQKIGKLTERTTSVKDLCAMKLRFVESGGDVEFIDLRAALPDNLRDNAPEAAVLVMRNFCDRVCKPLESVSVTEALAAEIEAMKSDGKVDSKALMRGVVKNKVARHNNVIADFKQEPDISKGRGTVVQFCDYPHLDRLRRILCCWLQQDGPLLAELNYYYDAEKCGIGFHGDAERSLVAGVRFGAAHKMPLHFQAYLNNESQGGRITVEMRPGDVYVMSAAALGRDWKTKRHVTWRHAAGGVGNSYVEAANVCERKRKR